MDNTERVDVRVAVDDERQLYTPFSTEDEFSESFKRFVRTKMAGGKDSKGYTMTVVAKQPLDEERFRKAMTNWTRDERTALMTNERNTLRMLVGLLIFGSIMFVLSLSLVKQNAVLQYSLLPIIGSLSLSKAAGILVIDIPTIRAKKWIIKEMESNNLITFEYENEKAS